MLLVVALAAIVGTAEAKPATEANGQNLLALCSDYDGQDPKDWHAMACVSYAAALMDAIRTYEGLLAMTKWFDNLQHAMMLDRVGALPKDASKALAEFQRKYAAEGGIPKDWTDAESAFPEGAPPQSLTTQQKSTVTSLVCVPRGVSSNAQVALVIMKFLRDHPEKLHEPRDSLAFQALQAAFPCPKVEVERNGSADQ